MVNADAVGVQGDPFELRVELGKVREFAVATHAHHPAYLQASDPVTPPTFLATQLLWESWAPGNTGVFAALEPSIERGLHAEQEYVFHGPPPRAGDVLTGRSRVEDVTTKQGRRGGTLTFFTILTEYHDEEGRLVAEARMTGVETSRPPEEA